MKRSIWVILVLIAAGAVFVWTVGQPAAPAAAGGMMCFLCHGGYFEGSDLAPTVAGTKLTDEQIANQMRHPRGVMPAFGPNDFPDPQTAISYIRSQPTGRPTMALSDQQRSAVLALIAGVAAARATEYARGARSVAIEIATPAPATVTPPSPTPTASPNPTARAAPGDFGGLGAFAAISAVLVGMFVVTRWRVKK